MKIAIKANKNINTPPTMGKIIGAACATASIASGVTGAEAPAFSAGWPSIAADVACVVEWGVACAAFDMVFLVVCV